MARDETARERDSDAEQALLDERSYLQLASAAATTVAGTDAAGESTEHSSDCPAAPEVSDGHE